MGTLTLDPTLRARLNGLKEHLEVRDENDNLVGHFLPPELYQKLIYAAAEASCPYPPEDLERFHQETGGRSLAEIWNHLGQP